MSQGNTYQCSVIFDSPNVDGDMVNVLHYILTDEQTPLDEDLFCLEVAELVGAVYVAGYSPSGTNETELDRVDCFNVDQPTFANTAVVNQAGTVTDPSGSIRAAPVISKKTGLRGRSFRGRMFLPYPTESQTTEGQLEAAFQTNMQSFADDLIIVTDGTTANQYKLAVRSEFLSVSTLVTSMIVRSDMGSIRGRKQVRS